MKYAFYKKPKIVDIDINDELNGDEMTGDNINDENKDDERVINITLISEKDPPAKDISFLSCLKRASNSANFLS